MRIYSIPIALAAVQQTWAQFFVLYGKDTVTMRADPILNPGGVAQHMHDFAGSGNISPGSNFAKLRKGKCASLGAANGSSVNEDRSAYWAPSLYTLSNSGGYIRVPTIGRQIYYKNIGQGQARQPFEFPKGFRMIAGSNLARAPLPHTPTNLDNITQWICHAPVWNQGTYGGFPDNVTSCPNYPYLNAAIHFPHCWNGKAYNAKRPYAHMSYPMGDIQGGVCPGTHPIRLPHIFIETDFYLENMLGTFKKDTFVLSNGDPTGLSWHADFLNGWTPGVLPGLLTGASACNSHDIGDCTGVTFDSNYPWASCTGTSPFSEHADGPMAALPGCNPVSRQNPALEQPACSPGTNVNNAIQSSSTRKPSSTTTTTTTRKSTTTVTRDKQAGPSLCTTCEATVTKTVKITKWRTRTVTVSASTQKANGRTGPW